MENKFLFVAIMGATFCGSVECDGIIGQCLSRSLRSRRMFVIMEGYSCLRFVLWEVMVIAFGLLVGLCFEWIGMGCNQVECWGVLIVVAYGLKEIAVLALVDVDLQIMIIGMNWPLILFYVFLCCIVMLKYYSIIVLCYNFVSHLVILLFGAY